MSRLIKKILVSIAGSEASIVTAKYAICLAKLFEAELHAIYVVDMKSLEELLRARIFVKVEEMEYEADLEEHGKRYLNCIKELAQAKGVKCNSILTKGVVHDDVVNKVKELDVDLLVIGELKQLASRIDAIYDEGEQIFREAPCSVAVVKNLKAVEEMYEELK